MSGSNRKPWFRKSRDTYYVTLNGQQINLKTNDKQQANELWHQLMAAGGVEAIQEKTSPTVRELLAEFLEWKQKNSKPKTYDWYQRYLKLFVSSLPQSLTIEELKPFHVTKWIDGKSAWKPASVRGAIVVVKHAFRWCEEQELIDRSPVRFIKRPSVKRRETILTEEQKKLILKTARDQAFKDLLTAAASTGMRPQELRVIEARHYDLDNGLWILPPDEQKTGEKTGKPRVIYLTPQMQELSRQLATKYPKGPLFRNGRGQPWSSNAIRCRFRYIKEQLGDKIPEGICLYTYRHTYATEALTNGLDPITVAELMGHNDAEMLIKVYQHLGKRKEHMKAAALQAVNRNVSSPGHSLGEAENAEAQEV